MIKHPEALKKGDVVLLGGKELKVASNLHCGAWFEDISYINHESQLWEIAELKEEEWEVKFKEYWSTVAKNTFKAGWIAAQYKNENNTTISD